MTQNLCFFFFVCRCVSLVVRLFYTSLLSIQYTARYFFSFRFHKWCLIELVHKYSKHPSKKSYYSLYISPLHLLCCTALPENQYSVKCFLFFHLLHTFLRTTCYDARRTYVCRQFVFPSTRRFHQPTIGPQHGCNAHEKITCPPGWECAILHVSVKYEL